jgi:putative Ca2+/H+ antiporter (TMEM165/GDT1 family)
MDVKLVVTTFVSIFVAELGDKTQLATLGFAAEGKSKLSVFVGSAAALVATSLIAVMFGEAITRFVSPVTLKRAAGLLFVVLGAVTLWQSRT